MPVLHRFRMAAHCLRANGQLDISSLPEAADDRLFKMYAAVAGAFKPSHEDFSHSKTAPRMAEQGAPVDMRATWHLVEQNADCN